MSNMEYVIVSGGTVNHFILSNYMRQNKNIKVIGVDKGIEVLDCLNIIPDYILGDFDSVDEDILSKTIKLNPDINIMEYNPEKDFTDTELAMNVAIENKANKITLFGVTGTRIDHMLANIRILYLALKKGIFAQIIDEHNKIYLIENNHTIYKAKQYGYYVSILPFYKKIEGITIKGFKYELENAIMQYGSSLGISNEIISDKATITCKDGILIVIESRD